MNGWRSARVAVIALPAAMMLQSAVLHAIACAQTVLPQVPGTAPGTFAQPLHRRRARPAGSAGLAIAIPGAPGPAAP